MYVCRGKYFDRVRIPVNICTYFYCFFMLEHFSTEEAEFAALLSKSLREMNAKEKRERKEGEGDGAEDRSKTHKRGNSVRSCIRGDSSDRCALCAATVMQGVVLVCVFGVTTGIHGVSDQFSAYTPAIYGCVLDVVESVD